MRSSANTVNKLYILIILTAAIFVQSSSAAQDNSKPDMPSLEEILAEQGTQTVPVKETPPNTIPDANKIALTKPISPTFFSCLKDFFTFKSKKLNIKTVEVEAPIPAAQDDTESFVDLGDNKLKTATVDDKDKAGPLGAFKQSQNAQSEAQDKVIASQNLKPNTTQTDKDSNIDNSTKVGANTTSQPILPNVQEQNKALETQTKNDPAASSAVNNKSSGEASNTNQQSA